MNAGNASSPSPRRRVLVTGVAGFIGMHQTRTLLDAGCQVLGVDNLNAYYDPAIKEARLETLKGRNGFSFERMGIEDVAGIRRLFEEFRPDSVVHLAAQAGVRHSLDAPFDYTRANIDGFLSLLEAARHVPVRHFLYASSSSVYGANTKVPFSEEDPVLHPISLYAATKRANELMAETYAHLFGIPLTGLRFFTVYGPWGRPDMALWKFTEAILAGRPIDVYDEASMQRDFTYIDDIVTPIRLLLDKPPEREGGASPHRILNIGNHRPERLADFIAAIEQACGRKAIRRALPRQPGDVTATYADVSRLQALTGFEPDTPIGAGIARFVEWYRHSPFAPR
ncbi:MAG: NAD-dependent epimerase/dehydratase family protein [Beijerinckiaceae bacterium]|nr:NAD-dependent epimerase/dehydratase family protein [Beijerinckiaceae bacterium]MCZ8298715.1 NAD-dependent epimerase/dehydratase family protein [Beijerinckiaceae bacterium]